LDDAKRFIKDKPNAYRVFPYTPDAKVELISKTDCQIINPLNYFNDFGHKRIIARLSHIEKKLLPILTTEAELSEASKETFRGLFHLLASSVFYIHYNIRLLGPWLVYNGNDWEECYSIEETEKIIVHKILLNKKGTFNLGIKHKILFPRLVRFINNIQIKKLKGKKVFLFSGSVYGLPFLKEIIKKENNNWVLNILNPSIKSLLKSVINILKNNNEISVTEIPKITNHKNLVIKKLLSQLTDPILLNVKDTLEIIISNAVVYTHSIEEYVKEIFNEVKIKGFISHQLRWLDEAVFGQIAKENNIQSILISHGSHPLHKDLFSSYEHKENARGLLFSPFASKTFIQSPNTIFSLEDYVSDIEKVKSRPLMWGNNYKDNTSNNNYYHNNSRIILHAGTFKELGMRPWIYETSNEYIFGLQKLVEAVSDLKNTHLIIKIRPSIECSLLSIKKLMPQSDNYQIISKGNFLEELGKARLLVSFSSTTIEEALYARKPVALFGGTSRYKHLNVSSTVPSKKIRSAVYHLKNNNLSEMLNTILDAHEVPLTDEELNKYTWDRTIPGKNDFINHIQI